MTRSIAKSHSRSRRGFALLVVLWVMFSAALLGLAGALVGRESFQTARNRVNGERALWRAEDCIARSRAAVDEILAAAPNADAASRIWRTLDTAVTNRPDARAAGCTVALRAAGSRVDLNGPAEPLTRALTYLYGRSAAGALSDALFDWRDVDTVSRALGAEGFWYAAAGRHTPRDDSLASVRELVRVRGFEALAGLDSVFDVEPGRISIANAPEAVLAAVPGFTDETVARILDWRRRGIQVTDLLGLAGSLTQPSVDSLMARFPDIARFTVLEPDAWVVIGTGTAGFPADTAIVEIRIARFLGRAAIMRRRSRM